MDFKEHPSQISRLKTNGRILIVVIALLAGSRLVVVIRKNPGIRRLQLAPENSNWTQLSLKIVNKHEINSSRCFISTKKDSP